MLVRKRTIDSLREEFFYPLRFWFTIKAKMMFLKALQTKPVVSSGRIGLGNMMRA